MKKVTLFCVLALAHSAILAQNVGIGTETPVTKLHVNGSIYNTGNAYHGGNVGIGFATTELLPYELSIKDGIQSFYHSGYNKTWGFFHSSAGFGVYSGAGINISTARLFIEDGGQVGIGTSTPGYNLDVVGNFHNTSNIYTDGSVQAKGSLYVEGNGYVDADKGIVRAATAAMGNLKILTPTYTVSAVLAGNAQSGEFSMLWDAGIFAVPPAVFIGSEVSSGVSSGELHRVLVMCYNVTTTGCKAKLVNTSPYAINYSLTYSTMVIGR